MEGESLFLRIYTQAAYYFKISGFGFGANCLDFEAPLVASYQTKRSQHFYVNGLFVVLLSLHQVVRILIEGDDDVTLAQKIWCDNQLCF